MTLMLGWATVGQAAYEGRVYVDANRNGRYDKGEKTLKGVCVSDGLNVVETGADGTFSLPGHDRQRFVFITTPSGYQSDRGHFLRAEGEDRSYDFGLQEWKGRVASDGSHRFLHVADTEIFNTVNQEDWANEVRDYARATRLIMELADAINEYVDQQKPWELAKSRDAAEKLHHVCSVALEGFRLLTLYLKPVLPATAERVEKFLGIEPQTWASVDAPLTSAHAIQPFKHLMQRVDMDKQLNVLVPEKKPEPVEAPVLPGGEAVAAECTIDDFAKTDLRVAKVVKCEEVEGSTKLLRLTLDIGEGRTRNVFSGIKSAYKPQDLEGRLVIMIANLAPRKMRFGISEGMLLSASHATDKSKGLFVLSPDCGAVPGMRIH